MRTLSFVVALLLLLAGPAAAQPRRGAADDLARARVLDREGVKAFGEGRYNDAIRFFEEAHRLGGPPFELWNIAKCHLRLDQPEQAAETIERYLETKDLAPDDRKEASEQLEELRRRPSTLTVSSSPPGATVTVDGKPVEAGRTPVSTSVPPGQHTVTVQLENRAPYTRQVEARYGRAVIVDAPLGNDERKAPPRNPYTDSDDRRIALRGHLGVVLPRYGGVGGDAAVGGMVSGTYRLSEGSPSFALGGLVSITGDSWANTIGAPDTVPGCTGKLPGTFSATALSFYALGTMGVPLMPRLRVVGLAGVGVASYLVADMGGDLFIGSCSSSPGLRPSLLLGAQIDYALGSTFRISVMPITMQLQPAFSGVRETPIDTSGVWMRFMLGLGIGVDFVIATLFDFNGVLIDDEAVHFAAFREVVRPLGIALDQAAYDERYLGFDDAGAFKAMLVDAGLPPSETEIARLIEAKKPIYMERIATDLVIFEGAKDIVERRAALGPIGIVSGALRHEIEHALGVMGVRHHVGFIVSAEDTTECKPHPQGYLLGLRSLAREGSERGVAVIEDSLAGVAAAKHAKLRCAAVAHSYPAERLLKAGADSVATKIAELTDAMIDG